MGAKGRFQKTTGGSNAASEQIRAAKNKVIGGSAMPLCGIVLPPSKRLIDYSTTLPTPSTQVYLHETHNISSSVINIFHYLYLLVLQRQYNVESIIYGLCSLFNCLI